VSKLPDSDFPAFLATAHALANKAGAVILPHFRTAFTIDHKGGDFFDPVTVADRVAETAIRDALVSAYPNHGIIGEEFGSTRSDADYCWVVDPIDGTRSFICGLPSWTTLIALLEDGAPILGLIDAPRLDERYIGDGKHAWLNGEPIRTSACRKLGEARLSTTDPFLFVGGEAAGFERLRRAARVARYGLDAFGYARLAAGAIDLVAESGLKPHDWHALVPVIQGAGGVVGNWSGGGDLSAGQILAAATPDLFEEAVAALAS